MTQAELLAEFLRLDKIRWSEAGKYDKEDADEYRRSLLYKLRTFVGRYDQINYLGELEYYVKTKQKRESEGKPLLACTANDTYLEELEIINECIEENGFDFNGNKTPT